MSNPYDLNDIARGMRKFSENRANPSFRMDQSYGLRDTCRRKYKVKGISPIIQEAMNKLRSSTAGSDEERLEAIKFALDAFKKISKFVGD